MSDILSITKLSQIHIPPKYLNLICCELTSIEYSGKIAGSLINF